MAVVTAYASTTDNYLISDSFSSLANALNGTDGVDPADAGSTDMLIGRARWSDRWIAWEAFQEFTVTVPAAGRRVAAAHARLVYFGNDNDIEVAEYDFGAGITGADWRTPAQLTALPQLAAASNLPAGWNGGTTLGSDALLARAVTAGTLRVVECTTDQRLAVDVSGDKYVGLDTANVTGTDRDPAVVYSTVPRCTLDRVIGAQVQLSDGTWAVLDTDGAATPVVTLKRVSLAGTATTIATLATGSGGTQFGYPNGVQGYGLAVDASNNLYVLARAGNAGNTLAVQAFAYSGGSWTPGTVRTTAMPTSTGTINQVVAAWHDIGSFGSLLALVAHGYGDPGSGTDVAYAILACDYLLTGAGSLLRASGSASSVGLTAPDQGYVTLNAPGTLLDVAAVSGVRGYAAGLYLSTGWPPGALGSTLYAWAARYVPGAGGTTLSVSGSARSAPLAYVDAEAKMRVLAVDDTRMLVVTAHPTKGITVEDLQNIGLSGTFSQVGITYLNGQTPSMPAAATLASSSAWDVLYDEQAHAVRVFYFDTANNRRLIRTSVDLSTHLADGVETVLNATVGASGSMNHMLRVARGDRTADATLVTVANQASGGGALSTIYVVDAANLPPTAPTLIPKSNYSATASGTFQWEFNDPNAGDTQGAFQLQINSASGASAYDTGKVTSSATLRVVPGSTLTNPGSWQWRVLTWDAADAQGEWSTYDTFATGATGTVNITVPSVDNPPLTSASFTVEWITTGVTQDAYRVVVVSTVDGSTLSDSGVVSGSATSYLVAGMVSDVQYQVQVTGRAAGIDTNTDTILLTPSYASPEAPSVTVTGFDDAGYILVSVSNPTPTGDRPDALYNDVLRRLSGSEGAYTVVGTAPANGTLRDYTAASGVLYEYVVRAQA
jgi:hypothetical protein